MSLLLRKEAWLFSSFHLIVLSYILKERKIRWRKLSFSKLNIRCLKTFKFKYPSYFATIYPRCS